MDQLINEAANAAYDRTLRKAKRLQRIYLVGGFLLILLFHFGLKHWDHIMYIMGHRFLGGFNHGLKADPDTLVKILPYERTVGWIAFFWVPGLVLASLVDGCETVAGWIMSRNRNSEQPLDTLPINGAAEQALSQLILRESLSNNGIRFVQAVVIYKDNTVQCSMRWGRTGFLFGFALLILLFIRYN